MEAAATEPESVFEPLTAPGPLSREELEAGAEDVELWIVRVPPQVSGTDRTPVVNVSGLRESCVRLECDEVLPGVTADFHFNSTLLCSLRSFWGLGRQ